LLLFAFVCPSLTYRIHQRELREQTVSSVLAIDRCEGRTSKGKRKKFDLAFHRQLEPHFPDWEQRMDYQKKQEEFYRSAMRKEREMINLRIKQIPAFYY
jgi:hypothetical protein